MAKVSPTQRSLKHYRSEGWRCQVVERWNAFAKVRQDLFGFIDIVAMRDGEILGIQSTTHAHHAARREKILSLELAQKWLRAGGKIAISSWDKNSKGRYYHREEYIS